MVNRRPGPLRRFLPLALLIAAGCGRPAAAAEASRFNDDGAFFDAYLAAKRESPRSPVKALFESVWWAAQEDAAPPSLARTDKHAASQLGQAESYYAKGEYRLAEQTLAQLDHAGAEAGRLRLLLALRGYGALPESPVSAPSSGDNDAAAFNRVLARLLDKRQPAGERRRLALAALDAIAARSTEASHRDRARLWSALLLRDAGDPAAALRMLATIGDDSALLADATLVWLNLHPAPAVAAVAAAEAAIERRLADSPAAWEARTRLVERLFAGGAVAQALESADAGIASAAEQVARLDGALAKLAPSPLADWPSVLALLPEDRRLSATTLIERRVRLQVERRLNAWLPYFFSYRGRLQNEGEGFLAALRAEIDAARARQIAGDGEAREALGLLRLDIEHLVGHPPDPGAAQRLVDGLARWETTPAAPNAPLAPAVPFSDPPRALAITGELLGRLAARQTAGADSARDLEKSVRAIAERNNAVMSEIRGISPAIDQALRNEILAGLRERRALAQQWINRLAFAALPGARAGAAAPRFALDAPPPAPLLAGLNVMTDRPPAAVGGAPPPDLAATRAALRQTAHSGETRPLRAEALGLLAELSLTLAEGGRTPLAAEAIGALDQLLKDFPDLVVAADVRYRLARAQTVARRPNDAQATLQKFESEHPGDPRAPEAALRVGELNFAVGDHAAAGAAFQRAIDHGGRLDRHDLRDRADFMLGWTHFRQAQFRDAVLHFLALIDRRESGRDRAPDAELERENFRAIALTFSYLDGEQEIARYFSTPERRKYLPDVYAGVAALHLERDRIQDAARDHAALIAETPFHPRAAELLAGVVDGARRNGLARLALERKEEYVDRYGHGGAYYAQTDAARRRQLDDQLQPYLIELAALYHADAQQAAADPARATASRQKALRYYDAFIDHPAQRATATTELARQLFLRGEARTEAGQLAGAVADYERAAYATGAHASAAEAGYAALVTRQKLLTGLDERGERHHQLRQLVLESERFAQTFATDPRVNAVLLKAADDALLLADPATAATLAERLLARPGSAAEAKRRAQTALGHARFELGQFAAAETAYAVALAGKTAETANTADANLRERLALSIYRQAEIARAAGDANASVSFLRAAAAHPGGDTAPRAEIDAAALLLAAARWTDAAPVLENFIGQRPRHTLLGKARLGLALAYENTGRTKQAADLLETLAADPGTDAALAAATLRRTGELRLRDGDRAGARRAFVAYLARDTVPRLAAAEIHRQLADLAGADGDPGGHRRHLEEVLATRAGAAENPASDEGPLRALAADAALRLGDLQAGEFAALPLRAPFEKSLPAKRRLLENALARYQDAAGQGLIDSTTEATFKSADLFQGLARAILGADVPGGLQALEREQYRLLLEEQSQPFEDKAAELHRINLQRMAGGLPGGHFDDWIRRSLRALQSLNPGRYERPETIGPYFAYALPASVAPETQPPARKTP